MLIRLFLILIMSISLRASGSVSAGTTSLSASIPGGSSGDMLVLFAGGKYTNGTPGQPSGWIAPSGGLARVSSMPHGADIGDSWCQVYLRVADGSEGTAVTVNAFSANSFQAQVLRFQNATGNWSYAASQNTALAGTSFSNIYELLLSDPGVTAGDVLAVGTGFNTDANSSFASHNCVQTGVSFGAGNVTGSTGTTFGDDSALLAGYTSASSGNGSGSVNYHATCVGNFNANVWGATVLLRLREEPAVATPKSVSDNARPQAFETLGVVVQPFMPNSAKPKASESVSIYRQSTTSVTATTRASEGISVFSTQQSASVANSAKAKASEGIGVVAQLGVGTIATTRASESRSISVLASVANNALVRGVATPSVLVSFATAFVADSAEMQAVEFLVINSFELANTIATIEATEDPDIAVSVTRSNNATIRTGEVLSILDVVTNLTVFDSAEVQGSEVATAGAPVLVENDATAQATEAVAVSALIPVAASSLLRASEARSFAITASVTNSAITRGSETVQVAVPIAIADSATVQASEVPDQSERLVEDLTQMRFGLWGQLYGDFNRGGNNPLIEDSGTVQASETVEVLATISRPDQATLATELSLLIEPQIEIDDSAEAMATEEVEIVDVPIVPDEFRALIVPATTRGSEAILVEPVFGVSDSATVRGQVVPSVETVFGVSEELTVSSSEAVSVFAAVPVTTGGTVKGDEDLVWPTDPRPILVTVGDSAGLAGSEELEFANEATVSDYATFRGDERMIWPIGDDDGQVQTTVAANLAVRASEALAIVATVAQPDSASLTATEDAEVAITNPTLESDAIWIPNERYEDWEPIYRHEDFVQPPRSDGWTPPLRHVDFVLRPRTTTWTPLVRKPGQPAEFA